MKVGEWTLYQYELFTSQLNQLESEVKKLASNHPETFRQTGKAKRLARIRKSMLEEIPANPGHENWNQGSTLGKDYKHWKRAKFGQNRFRLFFRYDRARKVIIYVWMNDENSLRKAGHKNDPYAVFSQSLKRGKPLDDLDALMRLCSELKDS